MPFLRTAVSFKGKTLDINDPVLEVYCTFWPWLTSPGCIPCEPDVVMGIETEGHRLHLIGIEAKYHADISSEEDERSEPNDQLARELDNINDINIAALRWDSALIVASRNLLYVTQDMSMPRTTLATSLDEFTRKRKIEGDIFWSSWRFLPVILENILKNEPNPTNRAVLDDMLKLLLRKGLMMFTGVESCKEHFSSADFEFYKHQLARYRWPDISQLPESFWNYRYKE